MEQGSKLRRETSGEERPGEKGGGGGGGCRLCRKLPRLGSVVWGVAKAGAPVAEVGRERKEVLVAAEVGRKELPVGRLTACKGGGGEGKAAALPEAFVQSAARLLQYDRRRVKDEGSH